MSTLYMVRGRCELSDKPSNRAHVDTPSRTRRQIPFHIKKPVSSSPTLAHCDAYRRRTGRCSLMSDGVSVRVLYSASEIGRSVVRPIVRVKRPCSLYVSYCTTGANHYCVEDTTLTAPCSKWFVCHCKLPIALLGTTCVTGLGFRRGCYSPIGRQCVIHGLHFRIGVHCVVQTHLVDNNVTAVADLPRGRRPDVRFAGKCRCEI
jgi:hypothetical protein